MHHTCLVITSVAAVADDLVEVYRDLHAHPELPFAEHRTAGIIAEHLSGLGLAVTTGVGVTGIAAVLRNGAGPTVMLRADMDGLPVAEATGLDYASTVRGTDPDGRDVPVMHACGHDMHVTALLGATRVLAEHRDDWSGTLVVVFQPAEENGGGAAAMIDDGLFSRIPRPDVVLGQHLAPAPAGTLGVHSGAAFASMDTLRVRMFGRGGHGSRPETTIDPIVMAASAIMRLQTIVSREVPATETAVVTVGQIHAGTVSNIIPDEVSLGLSIRSTTAAVRTRVLDAVHRIIRDEARASGSDRVPEIIHEQSVPPVINDPAATTRVLAAFYERFDADRVFDPGAVTGSEDVGVFSDHLGVPLVYWLFGGIDPALFHAAAASGTTDRDIPANHSPNFAPVIRPTLDTGISALVVAALDWLSPA